MIIERMATYRAASVLPNLTEDDFRELIAKGDADGVWTIYVTHMGVVWLTDLTPPESARFRWESYAPGTDYVGANAAADSRYVRKCTRGLIKDWTAGKTGYVDY